MKDQEVPQIFPVQHISPVLPLVRETGLTSAPYPGSTVNSGQEHSQNHIQAICAI